MTSYNSASQYANPFARRSTARKASAIAKSRLVNKPVKTILKKPRKAVSKPAQNQKAIMTLSRQVKSLQLGEYGFKQRQTQSVVLKHGIPAQQPLKTTPIAFQMNSFYDATPLLQGTVNATGDPVVTLVNSFAKQTFDTDIKDQYQWNEQNNLDTVSLIRYLPVYSKLKFHFKGAIKSSQENIRYRVTLFKLKNQPMITSVRNLNMPYALGAYWHMCDDTIGQKNYFSKKYHTVLMDKWVTISPPTLSTLGGNTSHVYRTLEVPFSWPNAKPVDFDKTATPPAQQLYTNMAQTDIIWCLISSNQDTDSGLDISIERSLVWRDQHGIF